MVSLFFNKAHLYGFFDYQQKKSQNEYYVI